MQCLDIQRGKDGMTEMLPQKDIGATAACTVRLTDEYHQQEHSIKDLVIGDAWF